MLDVTLIAACIAHEEGYYSDSSIANHNNNPGNIEWPNGVKHVYPTKEAGWYALKSDIAAGRGSRLKVLLTKYARQVKSDTTMYITNVCQRTGYNPEDVI